MEPIREKISLELDGSGIKANTLSGLVQQLKQVEEQVLKINAAMNGMPVGPNAARSWKALKAEIEQAQSKLGTGLKVPDLSKALGLDEQAFGRFLTQNKRHIEGYKSQMQEFRSARAAAAAAARYERQSVDFRRAVLGDLMTPRVSQFTGGNGQSAPVHVPASTIAAKVDGLIQLVIPGSQVQASVVGPIGAGGGSGGGGNGGGGGGRGGKGGKAGLMVPGGGTELSRVRTETDKYLREAVTAYDAAGDIITTTHDSVEGIIKTTTKHTSGQSPLATWRELRKAAEEQLKQAKATLDPNDPGFGLAAILQKQASQLRALLTPELKSNLGSVQGGTIERLLGESASTLEARASGVQARAIARREAAVRVANEKALEQRTQRAVREFARMGDITEYQGPTPPIIGPAKPSKLSPMEREQALERNRLSRGLRSFTPEGFTANFVNVAGWATAVTVLYKGVELAVHSMARFVDLSRQTAQLGQVFRGVGGTVQELTDDIMRLASAEGRDTEEGMESAKEWARLGLTRREVNEAVRVSMEAANVAGMHTTETTKQLSSLMHVYGLEVGDLAGVLGVLTSTSQRYNVTLEDLFLGLDRSAGVAKQAGVSLAELQGMIGAIVGKTGQSGVIVGNTIKSILVGFNNPEIQKFLRGFRIETTTKEGAQKSGSQVLREMYVQYQRLNDTERQNLTMKVAGKLQAARFVALMDNYIESQHLAIDAQLHLNTAQEANARILGTIKAQLAGVRAEWDRLIVSAMNAPGPGGLPGIGEGVGQFLRTGKNVLRFGSALNSINPILQGGGQGSALGTLFRFGTMYGAASSVADVFNYAMESPLERGRGAFQNRVQRFGMAAAGNLQKEQLLATVADALQTASTPERRAEIAAAIAPMLGNRAGALQALVASGDIKGARGLLSDVGHEAHQEAFASKVKEFDERCRRIIEAQKEIAQADRDINESSSDASEAEAVERKAEAQKELNTAMSETKDLAAFLSEAEQGDAEQAIGRKQEYINLLKEQQTVMQAIGELASQQTLETASSRNQAVVSGLQDQKATLEETYNRLDATGTPTNEAKDALAEIRRQQAEVEGEIAARTSPRMGAMLTMMDDRSLAARRATQEGETFRVGRTEAERLLRQEGYLQQQLGIARARQGNGTLTENEAVRAKQMEIDLYRTQEQIQSRILELTRQERQIRIDATREFQKNLLLAGPGEQLQRLYVASMMGRGRGVGSGEFMALSPELKRMYYEARGGDAGAMAREERALLTGRGQTVEEQQAAQSQAGGRVAGWGATLSAAARARLAGQPAMPLPHLDDTAKKTAEQFNALAKSASDAWKTLDAVTSELIKFGSIIMQLNDNHGDGAGQTSPAKLGITTGFSLGALHP